MLRPEDVAELADPAKSRRDEIGRHFDSILALGTSDGEAIVGRTRHGWRLDDIAAVLDGYRREGWIVDEVPAGYRFRRKGNESMERKEGGR